MSPLVVVLAAGFFTLLVSQFGARLPARRAPLWWLVMALLFASAVRPAWLTPVVHLLGIQLVSNFVLAAMILFLFFQMLEQQVEGGQLARRLTDAVSSLSAASALPGVTQLDVLVCVPCFNEAGTILEICAALEELRSASSDLSWSYCVVDDGSSDATPALLSRQHPGNHVRHATNLGVAAALLTGFKVAQRLGARYVVQCDADGQHPVAELPRLVAAATTLEVDLLVGSRFSTQAGSPDPADRPMHSTTRARRTGGLLVSWALRLFGASARMSDPTSGMRVYSARAVDLLVRAMPDEYPEPESIALLALAGMRLEETRVRMEPRRQGVSSLAGIRGLQFMLKVAAALVGLRLRSWRRR